MNEWTHASAVVAAWLKGAETVAPSLPSWLAPQQATEESGTLASRDVALQPIASVGPPAMSRLVPSLPPLASPRISVHETPPPPLPRSPGRKCGPSKADCRDGHRDGTAAPRGARGERGGTRHARHGDRRAYLASRAAHRSEARARVGSRGRRPVDEQGQRRHRNRARPGGGSCPERLGGDRGRARARRDGRFVAAVPVRGPSGRLRRRGERR
jgi:hypothetical protein